MKYYIIAGEASGDMHGALLMRALRQQDAAAEFRFWGGDAMAAEGGTPVRHIRDLAIMGFVEVALHLRTVLGNMSFCRRDIAEWHPDVVVGVDYPGFNLKIESWAHEQGFRTVHYISPNLWAWKKGRLKGMRRSLDRLCYILPFEQRFFAANNMPQAVYVGHPLIDAIGAGSFEPLPAERPVVALLPGSRRQELKNSLPAMMALADRHGEYDFVVAGMSLIDDDLYRRYTAGHANVRVVKDCTYRLLRTAMAAVVCSGTATLETALYGVPQVVCYKANPVSIAIARMLVGRRIRFISLVNLIADKQVVTELLQADFNNDRLESEFQAITTNEANRQRMAEEYASLRAALGEGGASWETAKNVIAVI